MLIKMIKEDMTTIDNFVLKSFEAGEVYEVSESTGCRLIARGTAELVEAE